MKRINETRLRLGKAEIDEIETRMFQHYLLSTNIQMRTVIIYNFAI